MTLATWIDASQSTSIARFGYEEASNVLWIEYQNGHKYKYLDVPQDVFEHFHEHHYFMPGSRKGRR